jgi:micrococcal nuclease
MRSSLFDRCRALERESSPWSRAWLLLVVILLLIPATSGCVGVDTDTFLVTRVIDGDTIEIEGGYRVRYIGIDAPERSEAYYWEALQANRTLVEGKRVRLERDVENLDRYGRLLRYVWVDGTFVNAQLVRLGCARARAYPPNLKYQNYLLEMEREAQEQELGLWASIR